MRSRAVLPGTDIAMTGLGVCQQETPLGSEREKRKKNELSTQWPAGRMKAASEEWTDHWAK